MRKTAALIMPALNEADSVVETLDSVFASTRLPDEIIVADGGSSDETVALVERYADRGVSVKVIGNPKVYAGAGRNVAVSQTQCDVVLLLDFGNVVDPCWVEHMMAAYERDGNIDYVCGIFLPRVRSDFEHCVACIHYHLEALVDRLPIAQLLQEVPKDVTPGALSFSITRAMWLKLKGMPDWLRASEDNLFGRKLKAFDPAFEVAVEARQYHHMRSNIPDFFKQLFTYSRGHARTGHLRPHYVKFAIFLLVLIGLLWMPIAPLLKSTAIVSLFAFYVWRTGLRKVVRVDGGLKKLRYAFMATAIVLARDLGTLAGYIVGLYEWFFVKDYQRQYNLYLDEIKLTVI
jgi:glycosyltransferase involved in cell wall biosynthesis